MSKAKSQALHALVRACAQQRHDQYCAEAAADPGMPAAHVFYKGWRSTGGPQVHGMTRHLRRVLERSLSSSCRNRGTSYEIRATP